MASALTKDLRNGTRLSCPSVSVRGDSDARAMCTVELEPHMRATDDADLQNLCSFSLDSCLTLKLFDPPVKPELLTNTQTSSSPCEVAPLASPDSLISFLFFNKCQRESHRVAAVIPGVRDMFLIPLPQHNSQEVCLLHEQSTVPECGPDGGDVHDSSLNACSSYSHGEITFWDHTPLYAAQPTMMHVELASMAIPPPPPPSVQPGTDMLNPYQLDSGVVLEEAVKEQLSRQMGLQDRVCRLQKRLQAQLGEHAVLHFNPQLEGLKRHYKLGDVSPDSLNFLEPAQASSNAIFSWQKSPNAWPSFREITEFCDSSQVVLKGLQEILDSEATETSSSDDESEEDMVHGKISPVKSCERKWMGERAELGSRWSWLQLRLSKLDGRIQQMTELHKNIRSTKGRVGLADSHLLTDRHIQQTPKREMADLFCTASDADAEPCSPTRLLNNIQSQSDQLNEFVSSLKLPLSFSPLCKQEQTSKGRTVISGQGGGDVFLSWSTKRKKPKTRRRFKADRSCMCARSRPLVTYHKRKLFTFKSFNPTRPQKSRKSMPPLSSSLSSSSCSFGSCDPENLCSDPGSRSSSRTHLLVPSSSDFPTCHHVQSITAREEWLQRPLDSSSQLFCAADYKRNSSSTQHNSHIYRRHAQHHKRRVMSQSPIKLSGSAWNHCSRTSQRKRRRGRVRRRTEGKQDELYQMYDPEESSDDVLEESYTHITYNPTSQDYFHKRQRGSEYNISDIVIPVSLSKVEKLQYKNIQTPSWRVLDIQCLTETEVKREEGKEIEELSDDVFAQRHMPMEQKEKLRWSFWESRKHFRHPTRSDSRLSSSGGGMCTSGEESSVEWSCAQLDSDEQPRWEEWLSQASWEPRVFPLDDGGEESFLSGEVKVPSESTEARSLSH